MKKRILDSKKKIALIAHDGKKETLLKWAKKNESELKSHLLFATGTTGGLLQKKMKQKINKFQSGPIGGDLQIAGKIVEGEIDLLIFFWDPLESQPHDPDIKALLRLATLWNIPIACNETSADFLISSPLFKTCYEVNTKELKPYL